MSDRGWARTLGVPESTPIDENIERGIIGYLEPIVRREYPDPVASGVFNPIYEQKIAWWREGIDKALRDNWWGKPVGQLPPNPLDWGPSVKQASTDDVGDLVSGWVASIADIVGKGLILVGIGGLLLMGAWLMFREPPVVIQQLRRAAG